MWGPCVGLRTTATCPYSEAGLGPRMRSSVGTSGAFRGLRTRDAAPALPGYSAPTAISGLPSPIPPRMLQVCDRNAWDTVHLNRAVHATVRRWGSRVHGRRPSNLQQTLVPFTTAQSLMEMQRHPSRNPLHVPGQISRFVRSLHGRRARLLLLTLYSCNTKGQERHGI